MHRATLKNGEEVAVKVQHPYVMGNSKVDMKTMEYLCKLMSIVFPDFKMQWLVDESKKNLPIELDFLNEGRNAEKVINRILMKMPVKSLVTTEYMHNNRFLIEYLCRYLNCLKTTNGLKCRESCGLFQQSVF